MVTSASRDAEHTAMEDDKKPQKAQTQAHADYTVHVVKAKTILQQTITPIRLIAAMGGLIAVKSMLDLGKQQCYIPMRWLIAVALMSKFRIMLTIFTNQPDLLQKHMSVGVLADSPDFVFTFKIL